jgi:uncharacterized Zn finger protein
MLDKCSKCGCDMQVCGFRGLGFVFECMECGNVEIEKLVIDGEDRN